MSDAILADKVAIVTGAAGGMGRAIAVAFAAQGARVAVADIAPDGGNETVGDHPRGGRRGALLRRRRRRRAVRRGVS